MEIQQRGTLAPISRKQAIYLLTTIWKDAPETEVAKAALLCRQYNLNPLRNQIYLVKYNTKRGEQWATILGIGASRSIAQQLGYKYSYADGPRLMNEEEQKSILGEVDKANLWAITILKDADGNRFPGYGMWSNTDNVIGSDKGNTKRNMAFIRSERNALDKLAPGKLPDIEIGDESYGPVHGSRQDVLTEGAAEWQTRVQEDIEDFWPQAEDALPVNPALPESKHPQIDMEWLRETLAGIKANRSPVYHRLLALLRELAQDSGEQDGGASISEMVGSLNQEAAARFIQAVQNQAGQA